MQLVLRYFLCVMALMLCSVTPLAALEIGPSEDANFETVGDRSSIYDGVVTTMAQDASGFIWIGTPNGLIRFDGYQFRRYAFDPSAVISFELCWSPVMGNCGLVLMQMVFLFLIPTQGISVTSATILMILAHCSQVAFAHLPKV